MQGIKAVGFEIEGGWAGTPGISPFADQTLIQDGSINGQSIGQAPRIEAPHIGEAVSPVLNFEQDDWRKWLEKHWPNADPAHRTNRTCGFHIHLSTKEFRDYMLLTGKSFLFDLQARLMEVGKKMKLPKQHVFWERMEGTNRFCNTEFDIQKQLRLEKGRHHGRPERYGFLNFAWGVYETVELRCLPTFRDAKVALRFSEEYFDFVNSYLEKMQNKTFKYSGKVVA